MGNGKRVGLDENGDQKSTNVGDGEVREEWGQSEKIPFSSLLSQPQREMCLLDADSNKVETGNSTQIFFLKKTEISFRSIPLTQIGFSSC